MDNTSQTEFDGTEDTSDGTHDPYLSTLEQVKTQYEQYVEVSRLYNLPHDRVRQETRYQEPGRDNPLTTNAVKVH